MDDRLTPSWNVRLASLKAAMESLRGLEGAEEREAQVSDVRKGMVALYSASLPTNLTLLSRHVPTFEALGALPALKATYAKAKSKGLARQW